MKGSKGKKKHSKEGFLLKKVKQKQEIMNIYQLNKVKKWQKKGWFKTKEGWKKYELENKNV